MSKHLHFRFFSYFERHLCAEAESNEKNIIIGLDGNDDCVFWTLKQDDVEQFECLNDGTCARVLAGSSAYDRKAWKTKDECLQNCGLGNWTCVRNIIQGEVLTKK